MISDDRLKEIEKAVISIGNFSKIFKFTKSNEFEKDIMDTFELLQVTMAELLAERKQLIAIAAAGKGLSDGLRNKGFLKGPEIFDIYFDAWNKSTEDMF